MNNQQKQGVKALTAFMSKHKSSCAICGCFKVTETYSEALDGHCLLRIHDTLGLEPGIYTKDVQKLADGGRWPNTNDVIPKINPDHHYIIKDRKCTLIDLFYYAVMSKVGTPLALKYHKPIESMLRWMMAEKITMTYTPVPIPAPENLPAYSPIRFDFDTIIGKATFVIMPLDYSDVAIDEVEEN